MTQKNTSSSALSQRMLKLNFFKEMLGFKQSDAIKNVFVDEEHNRCVVYYYAEAKQEEQEH